MKICELVVTSFKVRLISIVINTMKVKVSLYVSGTVVEEVGPAGGKPNFREAVRNF